MHFEGHVSRSSTARAHPVDPSGAEQPSPSGASRTERSDAAPPPSCKALLVVPTLEAGASDIGALDTARILTRAGHSVVLVAQGGRLVGEATACGADFVRLNVASKNPLTMLANTLRLVRLIRARGCDLVHAHGRTAAWSAFFAARLARVPFLTTWYKGFREQNALKRLYNSVMTRGERVIAVSEQIAELIQDRHRIGWERIAMIPVSIDIAAFDPGSVGSARIEAVRRAWGVGPETRVILVVGRMLRRKGHHVVIRAISRLKERGLKDFVCVFAGEDVGRSSYAGELWDLVLATGATDIVRMSAGSHDLPAVYAAATVAVSASLQPEGIQHAVLEAQAMKLPVVVSDMAAGPEVVLAPPGVPDDRMTGLRVPSGDDSELAAALIRLFSLPESSRRAIGERGRVWVSAHFDAASVSEQTLALYADLLRPKSRSGPASPTDNAAVRR